MSIPSLAAAVLFLASLLPSALSSDSELQGALAADGAADARCTAGDCDGALSLLQFRQKPTRNSTDEMAGRIAGGPARSQDGAVARGGGGPAGFADWWARQARHKASQKCYGFTGRSCTIDGCNTGRGAVCESSQCVCEESCAGPDGKCYKAQRNTKVAKLFTLWNVRWPEYQMYFQDVSGFSQLKTTNMFNSHRFGKQRFSLFKMVGNSSRFFLGPSHAMDMVASITTNTLPLLSIYGFHEVGLSGGQAPDELALSVCYDRDKAALMFGSNDGELWVAIHSGSWLVYAYHKAYLPGGGAALWSPKPAFDEAQIAMFPAC